MLTMINDSSPRITEIVFQSLSLTRDVMNIGKANYHERRQSFILYLANICFIQSVSYMGDLVKTCVNRL